MNSMLGSKMVCEKKTQPYFLQGLEHAKCLLLELKKNKLQEIQFSPIRKKHTKLSNSPIIEDAEYPNRRSEHHQSTFSENTVIQHTASKQEHFKSTLGRENIAEETKK